MEQCNFEGPQTPGGQGMVLKGWLSKVIYKKEFKPKEIENATILAFDMEDYGIEKVRKFEGRKTITYRERVPLGITLAYEDKNREVHVWKMPMYERKWSLFDLTKWVVDCLWWRETTEARSSGSGPSRTRST